MRREAALLAAAIAVAATSVCGQTSQQRSRLSDELPIATTQSLGLNSQWLRDMEARIRGGEFKKIGSILLSKNGKLAYERTLTATLRPRATPASATKTITGALVEWPSGRGSSVG